MKPTDFRDATFESIKTGLNESRLKVLTLWQSLGPATTKQLAEKSGASILTVRPRTSDLCKLGLVILANDERGTEGVYRAATDDEARQFIAARQQEARDAEQLNLSKIGA